MSVTVEIEGREIRDGFGRSGRGDLTGPDESPEGLSHFNVYEVRRVEFLIVSKKTPRSRGIALLADGLRSRCLQRHTSPAMKPAQGHVAGVTSENG